MGLQPPASPHFARPSQIPPYHIASGWLLLAPGYNATERSGGECGAIDLWRCRVRSSQQIRGPCPHPGPLRARCAQRLAFVFRGHRALSLAIAARMAALRDACPARLCPTGLSGLRDRRDLTLCTDSREEGHEGRLGSRRGRTTRRRRSPPQYPAHPACAWPQTGRILRPHTTRSRTPAPPARHAAPKGASQIRA